MCGAISDLTGLGDWTNQKAHTGCGEPCPPVSRSIYPTVLRNKLELFTESPGLLHHAETNSATNDERDT